MRIIPSPPFATTSFVWQELPEQWNLTIVCKATYSLEPGNAVVAAEQDAINEQDNHWDDDPQKSVYAPSDLVPYKPSPEIMLVGSAYAPRAEPVRSLFVRVIVGQFDKSIEVYGARTLGPDGVLVDGPRWAQMSLRYERAAGGEGSWNPVGVDSFAMDAYGRRHWPNLQSPGDGDMEGNAPIAAAGFGPVAARWPMRREKLGDLEAAFFGGRWMETPIGMDFDGSYFQSAPGDQFVEEIRADETIILENLHPKIERLVTRLPGIKPRAKVDVDGLPPWELTLVADTLWIDTNRSICTVTFRGQLPLDGRDQPGIIYVGVEYPGETVRFPDGAARANAPKAPIVAEETQCDDFDLTQTNANALNGDRETALPFVPPTPSALPWDQGAKPRAPAPAPPPLPPKNPDEFGETSVFPAPPVRGSMPTWLGTGTPPVPRGQPLPATPTNAALRTTAALPGVKVPPTATSPAPPPPVPHMLRPNESPAPQALHSHSRISTPEGGHPFATNARPHAPSVPTPPPMTRSPMEVPRSAPAMRPPEPSFIPTTAATPAYVAAPLPVVPNAAPMPGTTLGQAAVLAAQNAKNKPSTTSSLAVEPGNRAAPDTRVLATAAFLGAAEASTAAATTSGAEKEDKLGSDKPLTTSVASTSGRTLIDLLWFDTGLPARLEENPSWKRILEGDTPPEEKEKVDEEGFVEPDLTRPQKRRPPPPPAKTPEQKAKEEKSRVSKILSRGVPAMDVEQALYSAINDDGVLEPPLCLLNGDIELPFDDVETLRVLTSAAAPLAVADKKLKETIDLANEALGTPLGQSPEVAANFCVRIRDAWSKANRHLAADYLDVHSRRVLLEQRKYQKREIVGAVWIRALIHGVSGDKPIPTYLPADLSKQLPLFTKFPVRLIVEVLPQQDQNESHPIALRVHALARSIAVRPRR